ncbi:MAG: hypothetical protein ACK5MA_03380 [Parachlamydiaceae bacterium]
MRSILKSEMYSLEAMDKFFKDQNKDDSLKVTPVGRLGGLKVTFIVDNKTLAVSRNELTRWAAQLARKKHKEVDRKSVVSWLKSIDELADQKISRASSFRRTLRDIRRLGSNIAKRKAILVGICHTKKEYNAILPKDLEFERDIAIESDIEKAKIRKTVNRSKKGKRKVMETESSASSTSKVKASEESSSSTPSYHVDTLKPKAKVGPLEGHREYKWREAYGRGKPRRPKVEGTIGPSKSAEDLGTFVKKDSLTGSVVIKEERETKSEP